MKFYYKKTAWQFVSPRSVSLLKEMILDGGFANKSLLGKRYLTLKQCSRILYGLNQSYVVWGDNEYKAFITEKLKKETEEYYTTMMSNSKGNKVSISRENINAVKTDFLILLNQFASIVSSMIMDGQKRIYFEE